MISEIIKQIPPNKSIMILTSYRTGGTVLMEILSRKLRKKLLGEIFHPWQNNGMRYLPDITAIGNGIFKVEADRILDEEWLAKNKQSFFIIGLIRKDITKQIASDYIATVRNQWSYSEPFVADSDLEIDLALITQCCKYMLHFNAELTKNLDYCDMVVKYEDIEHSMLESQYVKTPLPTNYDKIQQLIKTELEQIL